MNSLSYGVMHRLPRVSPDKPIRYREYVIPRGVRSYDPTLDACRADESTGASRYVCLSAALRLRSISQARGICSGAMDGIDRPAHEQKLRAIL
jgi:hypothetical protein